MQIVRWTTATAVAVMLTATGFGAEKEKGSARCDSATIQELLGVENPAGSPVDIVIAPTNASLKDGIQLAVTIKNVSDKPYMLSVCSNMLMCGVQGLHPMISFDGTGMGLLDLCKDKTVQKEPSQVSVAAHGEFPYDITIPGDRIPKDARKVDKELSVFLCFELADGRLFHSNVVKVKLTEE